MLLNAQLQVDLHITKRLNTPHNLHLNTALYGLIMTLCILNNNLIADIFTRHQENKRFKLISVYSYIDQ